MLQIDNLALGLCRVCALDRGVN